MTDRIIYVNTDVNTGTYGDPDGTRNAGVRDGTSRTKGYKTLAEAFAQTANFLTQELGSTVLTTGNNLIYRLSGTTADQLDGTTSTASMGASSWTVESNAYAIGRIVIEGDPGVSSGAVAGLTYDTGKYRLIAPGSVGDHTLQVYRLTVVRNFQIVSAYVGSGYGLVRVIDHGAHITGMVFHSGSVGSGNGERPCITWSYVGLSQLYVANCLSSGNRQFLYATDIGSYGSSFPLTIANCILVRVGTDNADVIRVNDGGNKANLRVINVAFYGKTGSGALVNATSPASSFIDHCSFDSSAPGYGTNWVTSGVATSTDLTNYGSASSYDLSIKDVNSKLVNTGLTYSGSGDAQYVPQTDYLSRTRGSGGRDWDIGPDSWLSGSGGGGGVWISSSMWC